MSFISNFSYISDPSFVVMRQRLLAGFDKIWIDCLNGDSRETGKLTPEGKPDPSVFSTEWNREGIRVGTAIGMFVKLRPAYGPSATVGFRQFWGTAKRAELLASMNTRGSNSQYEAATPSAGSCYSFRPGTVDTEYQTWPRLSDLAAQPAITGFKENRSFSMILDDREELERRMRAYFDAALGWQDIVALGTGLSVDVAGFTARSVRGRVLKKEQYDESRFHRYVLRPFDTKWCYLPETPGLWNRNRPSLLKHCLSGNRFLVSRPAGVAEPEGLPLIMTSTLGDFDFIRGHAYHYPVTLSSPASESPLPALPGLGKHQLSHRANLSTSVRDYLAGFGLPDPDDDPDTAEAPWLHALAIGCSPAYVVENADGIRQGWPRIPLPAKREVLLASAELGKRIAALLDVDITVAGITAGAVGPAYRDLGVIHRSDGQSLEIEAGDLDVTASWGHAGRAGVVMPGRGRITDHGATLDIWLNDRAFWRNVPRPVWEYTIGGYQVIKKWLSYRERAILGRAITPEEARYVTEMVRRIAALIAMQPALDANYESVRADTATFGVSGTP